MAEATLASLPPPTYEALTHIEALLERADAATLTHQARLTASLFARRAALARRIPHFWALVLEQAPADVEAYIQPSDSAVLAAALVDFEVRRFEVVGDDDVAAEAGSGNGSVAGDPRSLLLRMVFDPAANPWFEDRVLEKRLHFRRGADGAGTRVGEPVEIHWRKGKDLTNGLTTLALSLHAAEAKLAAQAQAPAGETAQAMRARRDELARKMQALPEHKTLRARVAREAEGGVSFFAWFSFRGQRISAQESAANVQRWEAQLQKTEQADDSDAQTAAAAAGSADQQGASVDEDEDEEDALDAAAAETEVFPAGQELALALAEDVWPGAVTYFSSCLFPQCAHLPATSNGQLTGDCS